MDSKMFWKYGLFLACVVVVVVLSLGCLQPASENEIENKPIAPINANLSIFGVPTLNQTVELALIATPLIDAPNTTIQILLPNGFELVDGNLSWEGDVLKNEIVRLTVSVKAIKKGNFVIEASTISNKPSYSFGKLNKLYINVSEKTAIVSHIPSVNESYFEETMHLNSSETSKHKLSAPLNVNLSITGTPSLNQEATLGLVVG